MTRTAENVKQIWGMSPDRQIEVLDLENHFYAFKGNGDPVFRLCWGDAKAILGKFVVDDSAVYIAPSAFEGSIDREMGFSGPGFDNQAGAAYLNADHIMGVLRTKTEKVVRVLPNDDAINQYRPAQKFVAKRCPISGELYPMDTTFQLVEVQDSDGGTAELLVSAEALRRIQPEGE